MRAVTPSGAEIKWKKLCYLSVKLVAPIFSRGVRNFGMAGCKIYSRNLCWQDNRQMNVYYAVMRRNKILVISAVIGGIGALLVISISHWVRRCPIELRVVGIEPSRMIYFGENKAMVVKLSVRNSATVFATYDIPAFEAKAGGRWIEMQLVPGFPGTPGGGMSPGMEREETLVIPPDTEICRVRLRYYAGTWKSRFIAIIGPTGQKWVAKSPRFRKLVWPDPIESRPLAPSQSNTVEIAIPVVTASRSRVSKNFQSLKRCYPAIHETTEQHRSSQKDPPSRGLAVPISNGSKVKAL
jgi:hypothetical protein